ncbi:MAG TPA: hypothetical protein VIV40_05475 [Kofleriaceae bacterium]
MRFAFVVGGLLALAATAHADRVRVERCQPAAPRVIPADGAQDVPLNARVWQLGSKEGVVSYKHWTAEETPTIAVPGTLFDHNEDHPVAMYPLGELEPTHLYQLTGQALSAQFMTGESTDTTPPAAPQIARVGIELEYQPLERMPVAVLRFAATVSADTVLLQITVGDRFGQQTFTTTPDRTNICFPGLRLAPGSVTFNIDAIDIAGNRSSRDGVLFSLIDVADPTTKNPQGHVSDIAGMGLILFGPVLLAALLLGILLVVSLRHWRGQHGEGEAISPLVADHIARKVLRRASGGSVASVAAFTSALLLGNGLLAVLVALISCIPLSTMVAARRVMRELDNERARAELRETVLIVRSPCGQARLATSTRLIDQARRNAVPTSIAR